MEPAAKSGLTGGLRVTHRRTGRAGTQVEYRFGQRIPSMNYRRSTGEGGGRLPGSDRDMPDLPKPDIPGHSSVGPEDSVPEMSAKCPRFSAGCHVFVRFYHHWKPGVGTLLPGRENFSCYILMQFDAFLRRRPGRKPSLDSWYRTKDEVGKGQPVSSTPPGPFEALRPARTRAKEDSGVRQEVLYLPAQRGGVVGGAEGRGVAHPVALEEPFVEHLP